MEEINNFDILEDIHQKIQEGMTLKELICEYGGMNIYVPHYNNIYRKDEIKKFLAQGNNARDTALKFKMSIGRIYEIRKEAKNEMKEQ